VELNFYPFILIQKKAIGEAEKNFMKAKKNEN